MLPHSSNAQTLPTKLHAVFWTQKSEAHLPAKKSTATRYCAYHANGKNRCESRTYSTPSESSCFTVPGSWFANVAGGFGFTVVTTLLCVLDTHIETVILPATALFAVGRQRTIEGTIRGAWAWRGRDENLPFSDDPGLLPTLLPFQPALPAPCCGALRENAWGPGVG